MRLFKKWQKDRGEPVVWLVGFCSGIERKKRKAAAFLSRNTQYWNRTSWTVALVLFILLFGGCCLLLIWKGFIH